MPKAPRLTTPVAVSLAALLTLSACGGDSDSGSDSESKGKDKESSEASDSPSPVTLAKPKPADTKKVDKITVGKTNGKKPPKLTVPGGKVSVSQATVNVLDEGKGKELEDAVVNVNLAMYTAKDGKPINGLNTYEQGGPQTLDLSGEQILPGFIKAIKGQKVGSTGVAVVPAEDMYGKEGFPDGGVGPDEDIILYFDVVEKSQTEAKGKKVEPKKGLPKVEWKDGAPAEFTISGDAKKAGKTTEVQPLIEGDGKKVKKGDTIDATYTGATLKDGKVFDSSMNAGKAPVSFPIGEGGVIPGWDKGLVGQKVGSRVLLVIPAKEAYGTEKEVQEGQPGGDLVFVVDILGTSTPPADAGNGGSGGGDAEGDDHDH